MPMLIEGTGDYEFDIVGESHYQDALEDLAGPKVEGGVDVRMVAVLVKDDNNQFDKNAVAVFLMPKFPGNGVHVGYLRRSDAKKYRADLIELPECTDGLILCPAQIVGGWDNSDLNKLGLYDREHDGPLTGQYGVKLDILVPLQANNLSALTSLIPTVRDGRSPE